MVDPAPRISFLRTAATSMCGFGSVFLVVRSVLGRLLRAHYRAHSVPPSTRLFVAQTVTGLVHASLVGPMALRAVRDLLVRGRVVYPHVAVTRGGPSEMGLHSVAVTSGFMAFDALLMATFPAHTRAEQGGAAGAALMWFHHLAAIVSMSYGAITGRGLFVSLLVQATEISNIGLNLYMILSRGRLAPPTVQTAVGLAWAVVFFLVRVAPIIPWMATIYPAVILDEPHVQKEVEGVPAIDRILHGIMMPVPVVLNLYWFGMITRSLRKMLAQSKH